MVKYEKKMKTMDGLITNLALLCVNTVDGKPLFEDEKVRNEFQRLDNKSIQFMKASMGKRLMIVDSENYKDVVIIQEWLEIKNYIHTNVLVVENEYINVDDSIRVLGDVEKRRFIGSKLLTICQLMEEVITNGD
jgi:hypothetical protein